MWSKRDKRVYRTNTDARQSKTHMQTKNMMRGIQPKKLCLYVASRLRGGRGAGFSGLSEQYKKWRRGPATPATAATRAPRGAVSVPLPRTPRVNIRSKTVTGAEDHNQLTAWRGTKDARVAINALAVDWHAKWESARGGLMPSRVRRYRKTMEG